MDNKIAYKYSKEFPMPFWDGYTSIDSQDSMALQWMRWDMTDEFKHAVIDKLNGHTINFNGIFFIESGTLNIVSRDTVLQQDSDSSHNFLYFWENDKEEPLKLLMVRGWGHLTGCGGLNLEPETAAEIQDGFFNWCRDTLNFQFEDVELFNNPVINNKNKVSEPTVSKMQTDNDDVLDVDKHLHLIDENCKENSKFQSYDGNNLIMNTAIEFDNVSSKNKKNTHWWEPCLNRKKNKRGHK